MALAQIIDLAERRRARTVAADVIAPAAFPPLWCCVWMPVYYWYVA